MKQRYERAAKLYLQACYARATAVRVSEFAAYIGRSRPHVTMEMRRLFGVAPLEYLRTLQVEHAQWLLRATPARTSDIALASGFGTVNTFYRVFTAHLRMSPEQYRTSHGSLTRREPNKS